MLSVRSVRRLSLLHGSSLVKRHQAAAPFVCNGFEICCRSFSPAPVRSTVRSGDRHRWTRAEPPCAKARTCSRVAIVVSPGNVVSIAPCAHPSLSASPASQPGEQAIEQARRVSRRRRRCGRGHPVRRSAQRRPCHPSRPRRSTVAAARMDLTHVVATTLPAGVFGHPLDHLTNPLGSSFDSAGPPAPGCRAPAGGPPHCRRARRRSDDAAEDGTAR